MAAAKTAVATTEAPSLRDLAGEIQRATIRARAELDDVRRRLSELRTERESILAAPMHSSDIQPELERHLRRKAAEASEYLQSVLGEMRDRSAGLASLEPESVANFSPLDKAVLPEVIAALLDPADAARRLMAAAGALPGVTEGLPLDQRREVVAALDAKIDAAVQTESNLVESLRAAGVSVPVENAPVAEPAPGERRLIDGRMQQWVSFNGRGDFGWWPVDQLGHAA
jgi:hypothetical protein